MVDGRGFNDTWDLRIKNEEKVMKVGRVSVSIVVEPANMVE